MESKKGSEEGDYLELSNTTTKFLKPPLDTKPPSLPLPTADSKLSSQSTPLHTLQPFSASYQASGSSLMSCPDHHDMSNHDSNHDCNHDSNHDTIALNPQTQHYLSSAAFNTPDNVSFDSPNVFDNDSDLKIDPLNQSTASDFTTNATTFYEDGNRIDSNGNNDGDDEGVCPTGSEATGRWTKKEHELFTEALKKYGKEWKKVAAMVKTRTVVQTRTHAQKYFQKVMKSSGEVGPSTNVRASVVAPVENKRPRPQTDSKVQSATSTVQPLPASRPPVAKNKAKTDSSQDYYYDSELPARKRHTTYYKNAGSSSVTKRLDEDDLPPPSPASCGKRKDAEISAVYSLIGTTPTTDAMENGIHTLARMREAYRKPSTVNPSPLSIINPDTLPTNDLDNPPDTPWDHEMQALESRQQKLNYYIPLNVATSKEQDDFLHNVRSLIAEGDASSLLELLEAAKLPEDTKISPGGTIAGDIGNASVKSSGDFIPAKKVPSSVIRGFSPRASSDLSSMKTPSIVAEMLNRADASGNSTLHLACGAAVMGFDFFHEESVVLEMCKALIEYGASVSVLNSKSQSCVHVAAEKKLKTVVNFLVLKGCPVNNVDESGDCAAHISARLNDLPTLGVLTDNDDGFGHILEKFQESLKKVSANENKNIMLSHITESTTGLFLHGKYLNLPLQLCGPLHSNLVEDLNWAKDNDDDDDAKKFKGMTTVVLLSSVTLPNEIAKDTCIDISRDNSAMFDSYEDDVFFQEALCTFAFKPEQSDRTVAAILLSTSTLPVCIKQMIAMTGQ